VLPGLNQFHVLAFAAMQILRCVPRLPNCVGKKKRGVGWDNGQSTFSANRETVPWHKTTATATAPMAQPPAA